MLYSLSIHLLLGFISHEITLRCVKEATTAVLFPVLSMGTGLLSTTALTDVPVRNILVQGCKKYLGAALEGNEYHRVHSSESIE